MNPSRLRRLVVRLVALLVLGTLPAGTVGCDDEEVARPTVGDVDDRVEALRRRVEKLREDTRSAIRRNAPDTGIPSTAAPEESSTEGSSPAESTPNSAEGD